MTRQPFNHCYHCGHSPLTVTNWRQSLCPACGNSQFLTPTPAAVALVLDNDDRLLLMRRAREPGMGKLGLPGGIIEPGETAETGCSRELLEETGLVVPAGAWRYLGTFCNRYDFQGYVWPALDIMLVARIESVAGAFPADGEAREIVAVPLQEVPTAELAFPTHGEAVTTLLGNPILSAI